MPGLGLLAAGTLLWACQLGKPRARIGVASFGVRESSAGSVERVGLQ